MTTITEDYVSFETAKLLKEKGFDIPCRKWYTNNMNPEDVKPWEFASNSVIDDYYSMPTQAMAMKWLREVHHCIIEIRYGDVGDSDELQLQWWWELLNMKGEFCECNITPGNKSYEEACEAAIKYCLEILI